MKEDQMKSLMLLWKEVAHELGDLCCTSTIRDYQTITERSKHEGLSFLTITLTDFGKDFERGLDQGKVAHDMFTGFSKHGGLPRFLGGFLEQVFDRSSGVLLDVPNIDSIFAVRQLTLMFGKILIPCSDARVKGAMVKYVECEKEVRETDEHTALGSLQSLEQILFLLFGNCLADVDISVNAGELYPKHGPGATADGLRGNAKFSQTSWPTRLEALFPYGKWAIPNSGFDYLADRVDFLEPGREIPVKVTPVPKTLKTPRIIAIEPTAMQYAQQALMAPIVDSLESRFTHNGWFSDRRNVTYGMIGFTDQVPNQDLARDGSLNGDLATLDLSEASDRVSNQHVLLLLKRHPKLSAAVQACRSTKADVQGEVIDLAKFASMGSALCFPMEAMIFLGICFLGIQDGLNHRLTRKAILDFAGKVRVYGDDIIVPKDYVHHVISRLESFGYKVNANKSFWNGKFRESCGKEFFAGENVSITRVRMEFPSSHTDDPERDSKIVSLVALRNQFYSAGLWKTANYLDGKIRKVIKHYPTVLPSSPVVGRWSYVGYDTHRLDRHTHSPQVKGFVVKSDPPASIASGEGALLKFFLKRSEEPFADVKHLERQGRPRTVNIKARWSSPF
jgi:hypothetical protein